MKLNFTLFQGEHPRHNTITLHTDGSEPPIGGLPVPPMDVTLPICPVLNELIDEFLSHMRADLFVAGLMGREETIRRNQEVWDRVVSDQN